MLSLGTSLRQPMPYNPCSNSLATTTRSAGAVPVSGMVLDGVATSPWAPTRALHGDADTVVPFEATRAAVDALTAAGEDVSLQAFVGVQHRIPSPVRQAWFRELQGLLPTCVGE